MCTRNGKTAGSRVHYRGREKLDSFLAVLPKNVINCGMNDGIFHPGCCNGGWMFNNIFLEFNGQKYIAPTILNPVFPVLKTM